jgi:hypothetical protein
MLTCPTTLRPLAVALALSALVALTGSAAAAAADDAASVTQRPCFGAAARDPRSRCVDPSLRLTVFPTPQEAALQPNSPCRRQPKTDLLLPCGFGAFPDAPEAGAVLIGDSHATAWRPALDVVAQAHRWPAVSITRSGCAFSKAQVVLPAERTELCRQWNRELLAWLRAHAKVSAIFVSTRANASYIRPRRSAGNFETAVAGHLALWRALPATVKRIFVIRDTPYSSSSAVDCVRRAAAAGRPAGLRCSRMRDKALRPDPAVTAAERLGSPRVHVLDMTDFFCSASRCYPVVGGALVHKDTEHITATFAKTLGRYMSPMVDSVLLGASGSVGAVSVPDR